MYQAPLSEMLGALLLLQICMNSTCQGKATGGMITYLFLIVCKETHSLRQDWPPHTIPSRAHCLCQLSKKAQRFCYQILICVHQPRLHGRQAFRVRLTQKALLRSNPVDQVCTCLSLRTQVKGQCFPDCEAITTAGRKREPGESAL